LTTEFFFELITAVSPLCGGIVVSGDIVYVGITIGFGFWAIIEKILIYKD
jgi:hypothetical protein